MKYYIIAIIFIILIILMYIINIKVFKTRKKYKLAIQTRKKYKLAIQTVFIMRENIKWLEEWILYHINLGIEQFYLYDNTGSNVKNADTSKIVPGKINKYGCDYSNINMNFVKTTWEKIQNKYGKYITYIKWKPKDKNGNIYYGQMESIRHFVNNYKKDIEWTAFIDTDEFIFSKNKLYLPELLDKYKKQTFYKLIIHMKPFKTRFKCETKYVMDNVDCLENCDTSKWAPKNIVYLDKLINCRGYIHNIGDINGKTITININDFRFNHYNRLDNQGTKYCVNNLKVKGFNSKDDLLLKRYSYLKKNIDI